MVFPTWVRWPPWHPSQTSYLIWPVHILGCPQRRCLLSFRYKCTAMSWRGGPSVLGHSFMEGLFSLPNVQFLAFLPALYSIDNIVLFLSWCLVLFFFTSFCVVLEDLNWIGLSEDSPGRRILLNFAETPDRWDRNAVKFTSLLFFVMVSILGGLRGGPVWVSTCFEQCFKMFLFFFSPWVVVAISLALCCRVFITPILCSSGRCESNRSYWSVCVGFL